MQTLGPASWRADGEVTAPAPDILAAALIVDVFRHDPNNAPEWLWAAIENTVPGGLERLGRLSHDAAVVLGLLEPRMSDWLVSAVHGRPTRVRESEFVQALFQVFPRFQTLRFFSTFRFGLITTKEQVPFDFVYLDRKRGI